MKVLILTGIKEELEPFLKRHPFIFQRQVRAYEIRWPGVGEVWAATTGPHLKKRSELKKILTALDPDVLLNAGLVGVLVGEDSGSSLSAGERLPLQCVADSKSGRLYRREGPGATLVTVDRPIFDPEEKMDLHLKWGALGCDMEASRLLEWLSGFTGAPSLREVRFCKVAGDLSGEWRLYRHEERIRHWSGLSPYRKLLEALRFPGGPLLLVRLLRRKRRALRSLARHLDRSIEDLRRGRGEPGFSIADAKREGEGTGNGGEKRKRGPQGGFGP